MPPSAELFQAFGEALAALYGCVMWYIEEQGTAGREPLPLNSGVQGRPGQAARSTVKAKPFGRCLYAVWIICMDLLKKKKMDWTRWFEWVWPKIPKLFLPKGFLQMNSSDSQMTLSNACIILDAGISTFIAAVMLLYCRHELMPSPSGSRRKRLA